MYHLDVLEGGGMCKRLALIWFFPIVAFVGAANSPIPQDSPHQIEVRLILEKNVIHLGDLLRLKVEVWNVGMESALIPQNIGEGNFSSRLTLYLEAGSQWGGSNSDGSADTVSESKPDVLDTFVANWLTLRKNCFYGTVVVMDPRDYPQLRKVGHYRIKAEYRSGVFADSAARLNQEDIEKFPVKGWAGTVYSNIVRIQVTSPSKQALSTR